MKVLGVLSSESLEDLSAWVVGALICGAAEKDLPGIWRKGGRGWARASGKARAPPAHVHVRRLHSNWTSPGAVCLASRPFGDILDGRISSASPKGRLTTPGISNRAKPMARAIPHAMPRAVP